MIRHAKNRQERSVVRNMQHPSTTRRRDEAIIQAEVRRLAQTVKRAERGGVDTPEQSQGPTLYPAA